MNIIYQIIPSFINIRRTKLQKTKADETNFIAALEDTIIELSVDVDMMPDVSFMKELGKDLLLPLGYAKATLSEWVEDIATQIKKALKEKRGYV